VKLGEATIANIRIVTDKAHRAGVPVIYIQDEDMGGVGSEHWQIHPAVAPQPGDLVLGKLHTDAFAETTLQEELHRLGARHLVITGMRTEFCVDSTFRQAESRGYELTLVADGHTTSDNEVLTAEQTIAYNNHVLGAFAHVVTASEIAL
jgi:nicotinamidase-related amidase